jgi:hypothetical protein
MTNSEKFLLTLRGSPTVGYEIFAVWHFQNLVRINSTNAPASHHVREYWSDRSCRILFGSRKDEDRALDNL